MKRFLQRLFGSWGRVATRKPSVVPHRFPQLECLEDRTLLDASLALVPPAPELPDLARFQQAIPPNPQPLMRPGPGPVGSTLRNAWFVPDTAGWLTTFLPTPEGTARITLLSDFNADGLPDVAFDVGDRVRVALGQPDGSFRVSFSLTTSAAPGEPGSLAVGDFNADGTTDFLAISRQGRVLVLAGTGDGAFHTSLDFWLSNVPSGGLRLRDLIDPARISEASWEAHTRTALEDLGLFAGGALAAQDARELTRPVKLKNAAGAHPKNDNTPAAAPAPGRSPEQLLRQALRPEQLTEESAESASTTPSAADLSETPLADVPVDSAGLALVQAAADPELLSGCVERHASRGRNPRRSPVAEAILAATAAPLVCTLRPAGRLLTRGPDSVPNRAGSGTLRAAGLGAGLLTDLEYHSGALTPADTPHRDAPTLESFEFSGDASADDPANEARPASWLDWGQVVFPLLYLGELRHGGADNNTPAAPLQTPSDSRLLLADLIRRSTETFTRVVQQFYLNFLGRAAAEGEEQGWVGMLLGGRTEEEVLAAFLGTAEFRDRATSLIERGTPDERFLQGLHGLLVGRPATETELSGYLAALPVLGREGVAGLLLRSQEYRVLQITAHRSGWNGLPPTSAEAAAWAASPFDLLTIRVFLDQTADAQPFLILHSVSWSGWVVAAGLQPAAAIAPAAG